MPTSAFEILNKFRGYGDPAASVWFIGIEEGGEAWTADTDEHCKEIQLYKRGVVTVNPDKAGELDARIYQTISKVLAAADGGRLEWWDYLAKSLFREDGQPAFMMNLFPLGRPNTREWPSHYGQVFGLKDWRVYEELVRKTRFKMLREFWNEHPRKLTVCFGKSCWHLFKELLEMGDGRFKEFPRSGGWACCSESPKVVLAPFFNSRLMSDARCRALGELIGRIR